MAVVSLQPLLDDRRLWRGQPVSVPPSAEPTGLGPLDAALPTGGWPEASLVELLHAADGVGELSLLLPTLSRHTRAGRDIALVAPPHIPLPRSWLAAGVDIRRVQWVAAGPRQALWATEQCLRAGALSAVLSWPGTADDRQLRRLQVAAETGRTLCFAFRDARMAANPSPAALRLQVAAGEVRVLKCRGGQPTARAIPRH